MYHCAIHGALEIYIGPYFGCVSLTFRYEPSNLTGLCMKDKSGAQDLKKKKRDYNVFGPFLVINDNNYIFKLLKMFQTCMNRHSLCFTINIGISNDTGLPEHHGFFLRGKSRSCFLLHPLSLIQTEKAAAEKGRSHNF